jgi:hypothetical protein
LIAEQLVDRAPRERRRSWGRLEAGAGHLGRLGNQGEVVSRPRPGAAPKLREDAPQRQDLVGVVQPLAVVAAVRHDESVTALPGPQRARRNAKLACHRSDFLEVGRHPRSAF